MYSWYGCLVVAVNFHHNQLTMKWTYPLVAFTVVTVIGFGLMVVLKENIELAPWAKKGAEEGRLIAHTKNTSRLVAADAADLHKYLKTAIPYPQASTTSEAPDTDNWERFFTESLSIADQPKHVVIIPGGSHTALEWALPAMYFAFYNGSPAVFVHDKKISEEAGKYSNLMAYLIGPEELVPDRIAENFKESRRLTAGSPQDLAVKLAEFRDSETEFGWGRVRNRFEGYFNYVVTTPRDALMGLAAIPYAKSNNASLLYTHNNGSLPATLDRYAFSQRSDWFVTPSEGPFRHFWIVSKRITYATQSRLDFSVEKAEYPTMGPVALGDTEALFLTFIFWGIASAIFVWIHASYLLPMVMPSIKIAWGLTSLLLPVLGPILYLRSYRHPTWETEDGKLRWIRSPVLQSATATAMGFGYGATLMVAIGFLFVWYGFPIFFGEWISEFIFWLGSGMPIMMIAMYVFAVLVAWPLVQYPMKMSMMANMKKKQLVKMAFITTALSMLAVSLGMMSGSWYLLMKHFPMMPKEDDVLWFGSLWLASSTGFLVAWPFNWLMIRNQLKPGNV